MWLEEQIRNPQFRHCGCTEYALALMANQHTTAWDQWTEANRGHSQEEWIRDGFLRYGIKVHLPPERDDTVPLLRLLGRKSWDFLFSGPEGAETQNAIPSYVHYNAYRWLRDSGFEPLEFASSNPSLAANSEISQGLLTFAAWRAAYPGRDRLGVLALGPQSAMGANSNLRLLVAEPWLVVAVNAFIAIFTIGGGMMFLWGIKSNVVTIPLRLLAILWASPYTLLGLLLGVIGLCTGGHARIRRRVIEFYGGGVKWLLHRLPNGQFTLGLHPRPYGPRPNGRRLGHFP